MEKTNNSKIRKSQQNGKNETLNFRRQFNPNYEPYPGETSDLPSETVPDQSLTIAELLKNHVRGISSDVQNNEGQFFDTEIPVFHDLTEEVEYKEQLADAIKEQNKKTDAKTKAYQEQLEKEKLEYEEYLMEKSKTHLEKSREKKKSVESST